MQSIPYYQQQQYQPQAPYQPQGSNVLNNGPSMMNQPPHGLTQPPHGLPPMQHPGIPDASQVQVNGPQQPPKRKQVKNACTNCQKACKKCDDARPCPRCIKYGIADTCVNSVRKERKKGIKRGPYKRRQKTGEEKPRKNATDMNNSNDQTATQNTQYAPPTMRGPPTLPFGYPNNLNQYGQPYDPYSQYAAYHKEQNQMMPQPYVVNPVYPPMGYPVIVPGAAGNNENNQQQQPQQQQQQQQQQQHAYQHYNNMIHQQQQANGSQSRPPMMQQHSEHVMHQSSPAGSPQVYYQQAQQQQHSQPSSQRNSPHLPEIKVEQLQHSGNNNGSTPNATANNTSEAFAKPQTMTPAASTSTSTAASPDSATWVPPRSS